MSPTKIVLVALLAGLVLTFTIAAIDSAGGDLAQTSTAIYETRTPSGQGTGKFYMGREIADVMSHRRMSRLDRPEREREERTDLLVAALPLEKDYDVADIGAGIGYFSFRVAKRVPDGVVHAVDIQQEMLDEIERRKHKNRVDNVRTLLGRIDNPGLSAQSVDLIFIVDSYHEFSHPREMGEAMYEALRPGGHLIVVEDRAEDTSRPWGTLHKLSETQARKEITVLGFDWLRTESFLPQQHFLVFQRPASH
ncbi:MAG: class I SAM-dependent methyltransferase [Gammaproteobacteria bacterium]|nr:class I SAM-dependent methyltransferase [Gammaproteobacteria bacterium]